MYLTEKEASSMICQESIGSNYINSGNYNTCQTRKCMAWRWAEAPRPKEHGDIRKGYCGKVGRPQFPE